MGLLITFVLGLFILIGVFLVKISKNTKLIENLSISVALGCMISLAVSDLFPEIYETFSNKIYLIIIFVVIGVLILKLLDIFIPEHDHEHGLSHECTEENLLHIGIVSTIAIVLHNIIEGMAVYSITTESVKVGLLMALGVGLHNIPMGMVIYSTLKKEDKKKRILMILLSTISTFIGGLLMALISSLISDFVIGILLCLTLGMIIYIVFFELLPHVLHSKNKVLSIIHRCKRKKRVINKYYDQKDAKESFYRDLLFIPIVFVISSIIIPFNIYIGAIETKYKYFWIVVLLMLCFPCAGLYLRSYRKVRFRIVKVYHNLVAAIILFISILTCMALLGVYNANLDKKSNEQRFHITMQNSVEYTDQDYNYIGECGSAIFLYNRENESTVVLNMANLMSIVYYNKRDNIYTRTVEEFMKMSQEKGH